MIAPMLIVEHHSEFGSWTTARRRVAPPLHAFVREIMGSRSELPAPVRERHVPTPTVALIINFGAPHRLIERADAGVSAWVVGLQRGHWQSEAAGAREFMAASLTPIGAHMVLRQRMDELADRSVELDDIDLRFARELAGRVGRARDWEDRFDALEAVLAERLADQAPPALAAHAFHRVTTGDGSLASLAEDLGCSHRHLVAQFHECVGLAPKMVARLTRLSQALAAIDRAARGGQPEGKPYLETRFARPHRGAIAWADLAATCGYYDQSHFIRDFRAFTGWSPGELQAAARNSL
jgi:AraC-like DNA-binding protein